MARILDGNWVASEIRKEIKEELEKDRQQTKLCPNKPFVPPSLAVILCSDDPASQIYVNRKQEACKEVGIESILLRPFEDGMKNWEKPHEHLLNVIRKLNRDRSIHGILVQLPLPSGLNQNEVFDLIDPRKDVDVFSPVNVGLLLQGRPRYIPCTPAGIQELLLRHDVQIKGKKVCIINRSDVVGKPLNALLIQNNEMANATVSLCHDHTPPERLKEICLASEIIVVAVGKPAFLTPDMVPRGAVVVDVGINRASDSKKIVGDVCFKEVSEIADWISPVPGGVGPCTVARLLKNVTIAKRQMLDFEPVLA